MKSRFAQWLIQKFSKWLLHEPPQQPSFLYDFEKIRFEIRPADVLLIEGRNRVSLIIRHITHSTWTHSALYIGRLYDIEDIQLRSHIKKYYKGSPDEQLMIESIMGRGTIITPLSRYKNYTVRICRPRGLSHDDAQKVNSYALHHLGMRYSLRHIIDLARFLFPWGFMPRRWRSSLFVHNALKPTEEICSYLIASAFQSVHFPIIPEIIRDKSGLTLVSRNPKLYTPKDFDYSPYFDIIKYPLLPLGEGMYRYLPWKEDVLSGTEYIRFVKDVSPGHYTTAANEDKPVKPFISLKHLKADAEAENQHPKDKKSHPDSDEEKSNLDK
ncbi:MAG TPA: YiiX/YebB-like N1pC/P60 family cysteine hydrolase [Gammaproteobacteria bacterium]|nr:YiiX/YebB-like N1pC/P60 family cysteine hydrolase [Gammaproteobacteria bacterium]